MKNKEDKKAKGLSSLPGGGQVDGLPPAASTDAGIWAAGSTSDLFPDANARVVNFKEEDAKAKGHSSIPGGGQVDGLPPAASTDPSLKDTPVKTDLFGKFHEFFLKKLSFHAISLPIRQFSLLRHVKTKAHVKRRLRL